MKFDLHTHHFRCGHADGNIADYIEAGIATGLSVIGISDHTPYFGNTEEHPFPLIAMAKSEFAHYVEEVLRLKAKYEGQIDVLLGVESDYFPDHASTYANILSQYPFDYVIGSVHSVRNVSIFNKNRWKNVDQQKSIAVKEDYYALIRDSARSGMFQILGHIDAMKGNYPPFSDIPAPEAIDETLKVIAENGVAIEINTSGKTKLSGGWYPSAQILERAHYFGVDVSFGSDAHTPQRVAEDLDAVATLLKEIGFKEWVYYKNKQRVSVQL